MFLSLVLNARVSLLGVSENHLTAPIEVSFSLANSSEKSGELIAADSLHSVAAQEEPQSVITAAEAGTGDPDMIAEARLSKPQEVDLTPRATDPNGASSSAISTSASGALSAPQPIASEAELIILRTRGDSFFALGDIASARRFYERAAEAGDGQAALRLGESYDPAFLQQSRFWGMRADLPLALVWYKRARELGISEAQVLLKSIEGE
jgi:TPR repeat protein